MHRIGTYRVATGTHSFIPVIRSNERGMARGQYPMVPRLRILSHTSLFGMFPTLTNRMGECQLARGNSFRGEEFINMTLKGPGSSRKEKEPPK